MDIYEAKEEMNEFDKCVYGMALCNYTLGHTFRVYSHQLSELKYANVCNPQHKKYLLSKVEQGHEKACKYYREAYDCFKEVSHFRGM